MTSAMSSKPSVSFVIVNWNGKDVLRKCLDSVYALRYPVREIVVVDNGSVDGSTEMIKEQDKDKVFLIQNEKNLGAPAARNQGILHALKSGVETVYTLDNDLTIAPNALEPLIEILVKNPRTAMAGSLIFREDQRDVIFSAGHKINWSQNLVCTLGAGQKQGERYKNTWAVDYVGSGAVLIRGSYIKTHGAFDESYIGYGYEDTEYGFRANRLGYQVVCCGASKVWHRPHSGIGRYSFKKKYIETRNAIRFIKRYGNFWRWSKYLAVVIPGFAYAFVVEGMKGNLPGVIGKIRGFIDGLRGRDDLVLKLLEQKP